MVTMSESQSMFPQGSLDAEHPYLSTNAADIQDPRISDFQTSVWSDSHDVSVGTISQADRPPAYHREASIGRTTRKEGLGEHDFGAYDDHSIVGAPEELDVKGGSIQMQDAGTVPPLSPSSSDFHSNVSVTPKRSWRSQLFVNKRSPQSPSTSNQVTLTKVQKDICKVVFDLLQEVVRQAHLPTSLDMLESCAKTCYAHRIPLHLLLQEASIAGHTPFYWVVIRWKALPMSPRSRDHGEELLDRLIFLAAPLVPSTIVDLRLACLHLGTEAAGDKKSGNNANIIYQQLRKNPMVNTPSASDAILLEPILLPTSGPRWDVSSEDGLIPGTFDDDIRVLEVPGSLDRFVVKLQLKCFMRRMGVSQSAAVEFIARGRAWILQLFVVPNENTLFGAVREETIIHVDALRPLVHKSNLKESSRKTSEYSEGTWAASLGLLAGSPPVSHGVNARLVIPPAKTADDASIEGEIRERDLVEDHLQQRNAAPAPRTRKDQKSEPTVVPGSSRDDSTNQALIQNINESHEDVTSYLFSLVSRLISNRPSLHVLPNDANKAVDLKLQHFPFEDKTRSSQLLAPPLPTHPSMSSFTGAKAKLNGGEIHTNESLNKEARVRACLTDLLASFDDCDEAFDASLHLDPDGSLNAILEVELVRRL